jgi:hypothetical protein
VAVQLYIVASRWICDAGTHEHKIKKSTTVCLLKAVSGQHHAVPLCLGKESQISVEAGWAAELASTRGEEKHFLPTVEFEPQFLGHRA